MDVVENLKKEQVNSRLIKGIYRFFFVIFAVSIYIAKGKYKAIYIFALFESFFWEIFYLNHGDHTIIRF